MRNREKLSEEIGCQEEAGAEEFVVSESYDKAERDEKKQEEELILEAEKIYSREFTEKLEDILEHGFKSKDGKKKVILKDIVNKHLEEFTAKEFSQKSLKEQSETQVNLLKDLAERISEIPSDSWSINFRQAIKNNALNCSNCASLTGLILENNKEKFNLQDIEYGLPYGHAVDVVTLADGRVFYVDSRNNFVEDLELNKNTKIENKDGLKVYKISELKGRIGYKIIPILPLKKGVISSYLGNLESSCNSAKGKLPDVIKERLKEERKEFQDGAKSVFEEEGLFNEEKHRHLIKILESSEQEKILIKYLLSKEFKKEIKRWEEGMSEFERIKRKFGEIFDNHNDGRERVKNILSIIKPFLNSDLIDGKGVQRSLEECSTVKERDEFIKKVLSSIEPVIELRNKNPEAFREIQGQENFTDLKEVLSYGLSEDKGLIHIHLVEVKERKKGSVTRDRLKKDLKQLAKMIVDDEQFKEVKKITATSWIVAKYPRATESLGFTLGDEVSEEDRENHYLELPKDIPIRRASMTREEFLNRYLEK